MRRRSQTRWVLKWASTVLCIVAALLWFKGTVHVIAIHYPSTCGVCALRGHILFVYCEDPDFVSTIFPSRPYPLQTPCWSTVFNSYFLWDGSVSDGLFSAALPQWLVFAAIALPTAFLWWCDRRVPPGHCQHCGYDLTGNVSGRCPECGADIPARQPD